MSSLPITEAFTQYLADERHFSPYTARCYGADLRQFIEYLAGRYHVTVDAAKERAEMDRQAKAGKKGGTDAQPPANASTITEVICLASSELVRQFLAHLGEQQYSAATMARKIATLRSFYKWADRRALAGGNPMTVIRTPRQGKRLPKAIPI